MFGYIRSESSERLETVTALWLAFCVHRTLRVFIFRNSRSSNNLPIRSNE
jgi:hypothetical protein